MSYTPTDWKTGDVITADKLNNIEGGIADNNMFYVNIQENDGNYTADKTVQQVLSAHESGKICAFKFKPPEEGGEYVIIISQFYPDAVFGEMIHADGEGGTLTIGLLSIDLSQTGEETVVDLQTYSYTVQTID